MKNILPLVLILLFTGSLITAQSFLTQSLYNNYSNYREKSITEKRIKYKELQSLIEKLKSKGIFNIRNAGHSLEGRKISLISIGKGDTKILAWSQMHGDEPTATMALFDIFNFLSAQDDFDIFRKNLFDKLTIYFVPMLNPDGAEVFKRRNALQIDLNRDALRLQFPESKALKALRDSIKPTFGFNLHDQNTRYTSGRSYNSAAISFLAPAYNYGKTINDVRSSTMKVIVNIYDELSKIVPGHMAKYNDDFEPRAFGDNMVKWGTSSILIESGGWKDDQEKQFIRKLNFIALITAFHSIAEKYYTSVPVEKYERIPENDKMLFDLLLRNLKINYKDKSYTIDVGVNRYEKNTKDNKGYFFESKIEDIGDLSIFFGYDEYDCSGMEISPGQIFPGEFDSVESITDADILGMLGEGYTFIKLKNSADIKEFVNLPLNVITDEITFDNKIAVNEYANFVIRKDHKLVYTIVNGFLFDAKTGVNRVKNSLLIH